MLVFVDDSDTVQTVEADEWICSRNISFRKFDCYFCTVTEFNFFLRWLLFTKEQMLWLSSLGCGWWQNHTVGELRIYYIFKWIFWIPTAFFIRIFCFYMNLWPRVFSNTNLYIFADLDWSIDNPCASHTIILERGKIKDHTRKFTFTIMY